MSDRYRHSESYLEQACKTVPLGSQTFSKSKTQFPVGVSPLYIERGHGCQVWDLDGNQYTDFISGLLSVLLGYCDPDVDAAVQRQMQSGVTFSLPHRLEAEVSERLVDIIPAAEMVRFGKNGSDATSAAIRLARAYTSRDHVAVCGYHGWQDWYIGSTARNLGVPKATRDLTHSFVYNDLDSLVALFSQYEGQIAAVILEPMSVAWPEPGFLEGVKRLAHQHGAILIFDETITGFRFSRGGAQELFQVTPDLATFGKGLGNGYPISAIVGRRDIMQLMEDIFYSGTFAGETLSLAAAKAVMNKLDDGSLISALHGHGSQLLEGLSETICAHKLTDVAATAGHPSWSFLTLKSGYGCTDWEMKTFLLQEVFKRGQLTVGSHNLNCSHTTDHIRNLLSVYDEVLGELSMVLKSGGLMERLQCQPLEPLFKVR